MILTRIIGDNTEFFAELLPEELLNNPETVQIGVLDKRGLPCGAVSIGVTNNMGELLWIYVDPDHRKKGFGRFLLDQAKQVLLGADVNSMQATFPGAETELVTFLESNGFAIGDMNGSFEIPLEDLVENPRFSHQLKTPGMLLKIEDLTKIGPMDRKKILRMIGEQFGAGDYLTGSSPRYSFCAFAPNDEPAAVLISAEEEEKLLHIRLLLNSAVDNLSVALLKSLFLRLTKEKKPGYRICFSVMEDRISELLEAIFGEDYVKYRIAGYQFGVCLLSEGE